MHGKGIALVIVAALAAGCGGTSPPADAGLDAGVDGGADGADGTLADIDLEGNFGLDIAAGTRACPLGLGRGLEDQLRLKSRITFRPGLTVLPRESDSIEADAVERVELSPGHGDPVAEAPGRFTRTVEGSTQDGVITYTYQQGFQVGVRRFSLSFRLAFEVRQGQAVEPLRILDNPGMLDWLSRDADWLQAGFDDGEPMGVFFSCDRGTYRINRYAFTLADGADLVLEEWMTEVPGWFMFCAAGFDRMTYLQGAETRVVEDPWNLAYAPGNHNIIEYFAVRFDPPLADLHGLKVYTQSLGQPLDQLTSVFELDADLITGEELPVSAASYTGVPCGLGR